MNVRATRLAWATTLGAVVVLAGSFLPWLRSGAVDRSSYELFDLVDRLGFSPDGAIGWAVRLWPVLPLLLTLTVVSAWAAIVRPRVASTAGWFGLVAGAYALAVSIAIRLAPEGALFRFRTGTWVTLLGALVLIASASLTVVGVRSRGSGGAATS